MNKLFAHSVCKTATYFLCVLLCLGMLLPLSGCGGKSDETILRCDLAGDPLTLDPQTASDQASRTVISCLFEGLFVIDPDGQLENALAQDYTVTPDGLCYTFTLRRDAQWIGSDEDGQPFRLPVTAADFVFALRRLMSPETASPGAAQFLCIRNAEQVRAGSLSPAQLGVMALTENRLQIRLDEPNDRFPELLASTYAMPCSEELFQSTRGKYGLNAEGVFSNGPFQLRSWRPGETLRLVRSPAYYEAGQVQLTGVSFSVVSSPEETKKRLLSGDTDGALLQGEETARLEEAGFRLDPLENAVWGVVLNLNCPDLASPHIRRGIAGAFDRSAFEAELPGNLRPAWGLIPHGAMLGGQPYREQAPENPFSLNGDAAYGEYRAGLDALGKKSLTGLRLLAPEGTVETACFHAVSQVLQRELSLFISVEEASEREYQSRLTSGDFDLAICRLDTPDTSPWPILSRFRSGGSQNYGSFQSEELDAILNQASGNIRSEEALALCRQAEAIILEEGAFIPMHYSTDYFVMRQELEGLAYNPQTGLLRLKAKSS